MVHRRNPVLKTATGEVEVDPIVGINFVESGGEGDALCREKLRDGALFLG